MGVVLPVILQLLVMGRSAGLLDATAAGAAAPVELAAAGIVMFVAYLLQASSIFASWRLGFGRGVTPLRAIGYGLLVGLGMILVFVVVGMVGYAAAQLTPALGMAVMLVLMLLVVAVAYTTVAALLAVSLILALALMMLFGAATGNVGAAATVVGGSGFVVVLLLVAAGIGLWLAGRFSCAMPLMAGQGSFNPFAALADSWRRTWDDEWRIMRYLGVVGLLLVVVLGLFLFTVGAGMAAAFRVGGTATGSPVGMAVVQFAVGIPVAYLAMLLPAGIYRELAGSRVPDEVFA
jgi:hypothetical protein